MKEAAIERGLAFPSAQSEKLSSPNFIQRIYRGAKRWAVPFLGTGALIASACAPAQAEESQNIPIDSNPPAATATQEIPTPETTDEAQKPTPTPEVKKESLSGILSPEAEATGKYVTWKLPSGRMTTGMAFTVKKDESIRISKDLQVAGDENPSYNGYGVTAVTKDGKRYAYLGDITLAPNISNVGKDLPAGTVVGTIAGSGKTIFEEGGYNFLVLYPTEDELKNVFKDQTQETATTVNLRNPSVPPTAGSTFFDVKPPVQSGR